MCLFLYALELCTSYSSCVHTLPKVSCLSLLSLSLYFLVSRPMSFYVHSELLCILEQLCVHNAPIKVVPHLPPTGHMKRGWMGICLREAPHPQHWTVYRFKGHAMTLSPSGCPCVELLSLCLLLLSRNRTFCVLRFVETR